MRENCFGGDGGCSNFQSTRGSYRCLCWCDYSGFHRHCDEGVWPSICLYRTSLNDSDLFQPRISEAFKSCKQVDAKYQISDGLVCTDFVVEVSYTFDLQGPSASVASTLVLFCGCHAEHDVTPVCICLLKSWEDTACSSSLVCCNMAMAALRSSACSGALVQGVNVQLNPYWTEACVHNQTGRIILLLFACAHRHRRAHTLEILRTELKATCHTPT